MGATTGLIHPTAIIDPKAKLDATVKVGPYAVIDGDVTVGPHCEVGPHVYLTGVTEIGSHNRFHNSCVIGGTPQDLKYKGEPTRLRVGDHNVFREHVTVNCSTTLEGLTVVGSHNLLMASCHVAHDCTLGDYVIIANCALLAGHVSVGGRVLISGTCLVHQFVRIGKLSMMQGGSAISKDLPPYTVAMGYNEICGLNITGMRRNGMSPKDRLELKQVYRALFREGKKMADALTAVRGKFRSPAAIELMEFVASSKRGVCSDSGARTDDSEENNGD